MEIPTSIRENLCMILIEPDTLEQLENVSRKHAVTFDEIIQKLLKIAGGSVRRETTQY